MRPRTPNSFFDHPAGSGFTLIEILLVVAIFGIMMAVGMPAFVQTLRKEPLRQAAGDLVEGLSHARAQAILRGTSAEMVLRAGDGSLFVPQAVAPNWQAQTSPRATVDEPLGGNTEPVFEAKLSEDVAVTLVELNLTDQMKQPETHVRFYPNGTSDDFTIVVEYHGGIRKVSLDPVTGFAELQVLR